MLSGDAPPRSLRSPPTPGSPASGPPRTAPTCRRARRSSRRSSRKPPSSGRISPEGKKRSSRRSRRWPVRRDDRRRGQRRAGPQGLTGRNRPGSGAQMARTVSDLVLVRGDFAAVPRMVAEGQADPPQHAARLEALHDEMPVRRLHRARARPRADRVPLSAPSPDTGRVLPDRDPTFILALAPSDGPWRIESFARSVFRFSVPAAFAIAVGTALSYVLALEVAGIDLEGSRTVALAAFVMAFLYMIFALEATDRRRALWVAASAGCSALRSGSRWRSRWLRTSSTSSSRTPRRSGSSRSGLRLGRRADPVRIRPGRRYE